MLRILFFIVILPPFFVLGQNTLRCPEIDLVTINKYDLRFYKKINKDGLQIIDIDSEENDHGITQMVIDYDYDTTDREHELRNKIVVDVDDIISLKDRQFVSISNGLKETFSLCNNFVAKLAVSRLRKEGRKDIWELLDTDYYPYYFLSIANNKKIIIVENSGFIIPTKGKLIMKFNGSEFVATNLKEERALAFEQEYDDDFNNEDFYYIRNENDNKQTLRSRYFDTEVINERADSIYFDDKNIIVMNQSKYQILSPFLNRLQIKNIRAVYRYNDSLFQIVKSNRVVWASTQGKIFKRLEKGIRIVCGTVNYYTYSISNDSLIIKTDAVLTGGEVEIEKFRIEKLASEFVTFLDGSSSYSYNGNEISSDFSELAHSLLLFRSGEFYGLKKFEIKNGVIEFKELLPTEYSSIDFFGYYYPLRIKKNRLYSYFQINSKVQCKALEKFNNNFARFELIDGRRGWLDLRGNEYMDE